MKRVLILSISILSLSMILLECNYSEKRKTAIKEHSSPSTRKGQAGLKNDSIIKSHSVSEPKKNIVYTSDIEPYKQVDSLIGLFNKKHKFIYLSKIDSICTKSDGDLTEQLDLACTRLFDNDTGIFIEYLQKNPNSCLQDRLIEGLGEDYSPYDIKERPAKLIKDRNKLTDKAKADGLSNRKIKFIQFIFNSVNPNILD